MIDQSLYPFSIRRELSSSVLPPPDKLGCRTARNLIRSGYKNIQLVGQKRSVHGSSGSLRLKMQPGFDLAVLIVPAQDMVNVIHACGSRGSKPPS
jgi:hypothetical protein